MNLGQLNGPALNGGWLGNVHSASATLGGVGVASAAPSHTVIITTPKKIIGKGVAFAKLIKMQQGDAAVVGAASIYMAPISVAVPGAASLLATATIQASALRTEQASAGFTGLATARFLNTSATGFLGRGTIGATAVRTRYFKPPKSSKSIVGKGLFVPKAVRVHMPSVAFGGVGSLWVSDVKINAHYYYIRQPVVGVGAFAVDMTKVRWNIAAVPTGTAGIEIPESDGNWETVTIIRGAAATPHGTGTVTAAATTIKQAAGAAVGTGTYASSALRTRLPLSNIIGKGFVFGKSRRVQFAAAAPAGTATIAALGATRLLATSTFAGTAAMTGDGNRLHRGSAQCSGSASVAAEGYINLGLHGTQGALFYRPAAVRIFNRPLHQRIWRTDKMSTLGTVTKQPSERDYFTINYSKDISKTDTVSAVVSCVAAPAGLSVSPVILGDGRSLKVAYYSGTDRTKYKVTAIVDTAEGQRFEDEVYVTVKEL